MNNEQLQGKPPVNELKTIQTREAVQSTLALFLNRCPNVKRDLLSRLKYIREKFQDSSYFQTHEASFQYLLSLFVCFLFIFACVITNKDLVCSQPTGCR